MLGGGGAPDVMKAAVVKARLVSAKDILNECFEMGGGARGRAESGACSPGRSICAVARIRERFERETGRQRPAYPSGGQCYAGL